MSTDQLTYGGSLVIRRCWCGIRHAIPSELDDHIDKGGSAFCPLGHSYVQKDPTEQERIKRLEAQLVHERDQKYATERRLIAQRAATTRVKNRARAGVCPDCKRSFQNVVKHMETKHPELVPGASGTSTPKEG